MLMICGVSSLAHAMASTPFSLPAMYQAGLPHARFLVPTNTFGMRFPIRRSWNAAPQSGKPSAQIHPLIFGAALTSLYFAYAPSQSSLLYR